MVYIDNEYFACTNKQERKKNIGLAYVDKVHLQNLIMKKKKENGRKISVRP